jgi:hypothetical protein
VAHPPHGHVRQRSSRAGMIWRRRPLARSEEGTMKRVLWIGAMLYIAFSLSNQPAQAAAMDVCEPDPCITIVFCSTACARCDVAPDGEEGKVCLWP